MSIPENDVLDVLGRLTDDKEIRRFTRFLSPKSVVRVARRFRPQRRDSRAEFVLTVGAPNHRERQLIARAKRDGLGLPESLVAFFPKKKGKR